MYEKIISGFVRAKIVNVLLIFTRISRIYLNLKFFQFLNLKSKIAIQKSKINTSPRSLELLLPIKKFADLGKILNVKPVFL